MKPFFDSTLPRGGDHTLSGPVAVVLGIGIFVSVFVAQIIQAVELRRETADFQLASEQAVRAMEDRIDSQIELIRSIVSLFNSSSHVERAEFQSFVADSLARHPSIQIVGWAPRVLGSERAQFETLAQQDGLAGYRINERSTDRRPIPAGQRDEYFPNLYLEPPPASPATYGLDQAYEPARRVALDLARDTGELVFSERLDLALVTENRTAILAYAPIYRGERRPASVEQRRNQLMGYAYGVVRPSMIVEGMIKDQTRFNRNGIKPRSMRIDVYDTTDSESRFLFCYSGEAPDPNETASDVISTRRNDVLSVKNFGGRQWTFIARPTDGILAGTVTISWQTGVAFAGSIALCILLAIYLHTLINRSRAIEAEVGLRTNELRSTNELLRSSEDRIRLITNSVPALIAYVDRTLTYRFANQRYKEIGVHPDSLIGKSLSEVRRSQPYEAIEPYFKRAANGEFVKFEIEAEDRNGNIRYSALECTPDVGPEGPRGFYILGRDVTDARNAEKEIQRTNELLRQSEDRIRAIADSVPALIAYIDRDLIYRFANKRYRDIGIDPQRLIGQPIQNRLQDGSYEIIRPYFERAARGEEVVFEITPIDPNGEMRYRSISCTPDIVNGEVRGFYLLGRDITEQRNAENKLQSANDLLRSSEERLRVITNSLPALIAHVDRDMQIQYTNERFSILGVDFEDAVGKSFETFIGPDKYQHLRVACERALLGEASQLEITVETSQGREISILSEFTPDVGYNGEVGGFYFAALNVTAQRALEVELDRFFRQSLSFMWVATFDGFLRRFNDTWRTVLGYTHDELVSTPYIQFVHPDDRAKVDGALERLKMGRDLTNLDVRMLTKDGSERFILWNAAADPQERQIYATGHDITELKAVDRMKDEFVSTVSHELRTPLTSIKGALGLIRAKTLGSLPADMNMMLDIAYKNCDRLVLLINDILDMEKIEAGKMDFKFEPVDILSIVRNAIAANQPYADQFGAKLSLKTGLERATIRADEGRMMQVMANLLSNAAKFSPENGAIEVQVEHCGRMIRISVEDHGPGIPEDFRPRIFEKFSQSDSSDRRKVSGTGLGLSIVRAIIERHGGRIDFNTQVGKGSTFYFEIPELSVNLPIGSSNGQRILICEDDPDVAEILRGIVERCGHSGDIALSAAQAKALLEKNNYAGMTLDIMLPDMNGFDLFRQIRAQPRTRLLPVIIVSAKASESADRINGSAINIVDWLDKPLDDDRMAAAVRSAIAMNAQSTPRILHIEDDPDLIQIVGRQVGSHVSIVSAGSLAAARQLIGKERFDLVVLDLILPDGRGEDLLPIMINPDGSPLPVIIFSAIEVPAEISSLVETVLVKTRSTDQMLTQAIDAFVARNNLVSSHSDSNIVDNRTDAHG